MFSQFFCNNVFLYLVKNNVVCILIYFNHSIDWTVNVIMEHIFNLHELSLL